MNHYCLPHEFHHLHVDKMPEASIYTYFTSKTVCSQIYFDQEFCLLVSFVFGALWHLHRKISIRDEGGFHLPFYPAWLKLLQGAKAGLARKT